MRSVTKMTAVLGVCLGLASAGWAQKGKGNAGGRGNAPPSQTMPDRSNKGGDVRGEQRAEEVHEMNQEKKAAHKTKKKGTTHKGKAKGKATGNEKNK